MKAKTFTTMGALHPVLFFVVVYIVALFFSIFICSSLSCHKGGITCVGFKFIFNFSHNDP